MKNLLRFFSTILLFLFSVLSVVGQVTIGIHDFELTNASPAMTRSTGTTSGSPGTSAVVTGNSPSSNASPANSPYFTSSSRGYRHAGPSSGSTAAIVTHTFGAVDTRGYSSISVSIRVASMSIGSTSNGIESTDYCEIAVSPDNGVTWYQQSRIIGDASNNNKRWAFSGTGSATRAYQANNTLTNHAVGGGSTQLISGSTAITTMTVTGLPAVQNLRIRVQTRNDSGNESWIIDDVRVTGTLSTFTVTFNGNGSTGGSMSNQTASAATNLTANAFTRTGYTFAGWATSAGGPVVYANSASYPFTANITLYAVWTANTYTVTFNGNGGGTPSPTSKTVTYASTYGTLATVSRSGYTFAGWNTAANGSGVTITDATTVSITANQTLYAQWIPNIYWDNNGITAGTDNTGGNWSATNWSSNSLGTVATGNFADNTTPIFSAGTNGTGTFTVEVDAAVNANGISFEEGTVTLGASTGTLTLTGATVTVASGATGIITEPVLGSVGLTKAGAGLLTLTGSNTFTGNINITAGTLIASGAVPSILNNRPIDISSGAILRYSANTDFQITNQAITGAGNIEQDGLRITPRGNINDHTGDLVINSGDYDSRTGQAIGNTSRVIINNPGKLTIVLTGDETVGTIEGNGELNFYGAGTPRLYLSGNTNRTFSGIITGGGQSPDTDPITGTGVLIKNGTGALTLSGANSFTGGITLNNGTLNLQNTSALGTGRFYINGGNIDVLGSNLTISNNFHQTWGGNFTFIGTYDLNIGDNSLGTVTLTGNRTVTVSNNNLIVQGAIAGAYSLTKAGAGTLRLRGNSNYSGGTTVSAGALLATGLTTTGSNTGEGTVVVQSGATIGGTQQIGFATTGPVTINDGGKIAPGAFAIGTLTAKGNVTINGTFEVEYNASTTDRLNVNGNLVLGSTSALNFVEIATLNSGTYIIAQYGGTLTGTFNTVNNLPAGFEIDYAYQGDKIVIKPAATIITTTAASYGPFCNATSNNISVAFTSSGPITGTYSVQLSDANGNFPANATDNLIGSGTSPITAIIPASQAAGTGYRVRVVNNTPATLGTDNGSNIEINANPTVPTGSATQSFCSAVSPTVASLSATGTAIKWYNQSSAGTEYLSTAALVNGTTYYASQTVNGCESTSRLAVTVTVNTTPAAPTGSAAQSFCSAVSPTVAGLSATGTAIKWYNQSSVGTEYSSSDVLVNGTTYYASQTVNGCESTSRLAVTVTVNTTPAAPTGATPQVFCSSASPTVANLSATGTAIKWYNQSSGGTEYLSTAALVNGTTYHASQTVNGCESTSRLAVVANVNTPPATPTFTTATATNNNATPCLVANTYAINAQSGYSYSWSVPSGWGAVSGGTTNQITVTPSIATGAVSVSVTIAGCSPAINSINVTPVAIPAAPVANSNTTPQITNVGVNDFIANWSSVSGATGYDLEVSTTIQSTTTETFTSIGGGTTSSYLTRSWTGAGSITWEAYNARIDQTLTASNDAITLRDVAGSFIQSGVINGNPTSIIFDVQQKFTGSGGLLSVKILSGIGYSTSTTIGTYSYTTTLATGVSFPVSGITGPFKILIENNTAARPCIDNLSFIVELETPIVGSPFIINSGSTLTQSVTGLEQGTTYYYRVKAKNTCGSSGNSNVVAVTTLNPITTGTIAGSPLCAGANVDVPFTIGTAFNAGNIFTAQLSNAAGDFSSPVSIGTLTQTTAGTITATIPANTPQGSGYRIRVVSNNPAYTGVVNTSNITINTITTASVTTNAATGVTSVAAQLNGNVTSAGCTTVTTRGFVYSAVNTIPTIGGSNVTDVQVGNGAGAFNTILTGLNCNTTYYFRAYATNSQGTTYGTTLNFFTSKVVIAAQDFESSPATPTWTYSTANTSGTPNAAGIVTGNNGSGSPANANYFSGGSRGYLIQSSGSSSNSGLAEHTLTFSNVNTVSYNEVEASFRVAGMSVNTANGIDPEDNVRVEISPDGGTTWYYQSRLTGSSSSNSSWAFSGTGSTSRSYQANNTFSSFAVGGSGSLLTGNNAITTITVTNLPSVPNLRMRIVLSLTNESSTNELWIIDDVRITGCENTCTAPDAIAFVNQPANVLQDAAMSAVTVRALCTTTGQTATNYSGVITLTVSGGGCGYESQTVTAVNGIATFSNIIFKRSAQSNISLTASASGFTNVVSNTFNVTAPAGGVTTIAARNFDATNTLSYSTSVGGSGVFNTTNTRGVGNSNCLAFYYNECLKGASGSASTATFTQASGLTGFTSKKFKFRLALGGEQLAGALCDNFPTSGFGMDVDDYIRLEVSINGGSYDQAFQMNGFSNLQYNFNSNTITLNHNANLVIGYTTEPSTFIVSLPANATSAAFRFTLKSNRRNEIWYLDDLSIEGNATGTPLSLPVVEAGNNFTGCPGGPNELLGSATNTVGDITIEWTPSGSLSNTNTFNPIASNIAQQAYTLKVTDEDGCEGTDVVTVSVLNGAAGTWTGAKNQNWFECKNWASGIIPDATVNVTIPNVTNDPEIALTDARCNNITFETGSNLFMTTDDSELEVYGDWTNNSGGNLSLRGATDATVLFKGNSPAALSGNSETYYQKLIIENPALSINANADVAELTTIKGGVDVLSTRVFKSKKVSLGNEWTLVDDFNSLNLANLSGQNGWVSDGATVVADPANASNQVLSIVPANTYAYKNMFTATANSVHTVYYRIRIDNIDIIGQTTPSGESAGFGGISDAATPTAFGNYRVQNGVNPAFGTPTCTNGSTTATSYFHCTTTGTTLNKFLTDNHPVSDTWYNLWFVIDNDGFSNGGTAQYRVYIQGGAYSTVTLLQWNDVDLSNHCDNLITDLSLRGGGSLSASVISKIFFRTGAAHQSPLYFDDVYFSEGINTTNPFKPSLNISSGAEVRVNE